MAKIYLVRHGQAAANWGQDLDPPLSELGKAQAQSVSQDLQKLIAAERKVNIISSPIRRALETSIPFCQARGQEASIESKVAEIPNPLDNMDDRLPWLMNIMKDDWANLSPTLLSWRSDCIHYLSQLTHDSVIFSHYIAINVIIGYCQGKDKVISYHPDNTSIHIFENHTEQINNNSANDLKLRIISLGKEANTSIN